MRRCNNLAHAGVGDTRIGATELIVDLGITLGLGFEVAIRLHT